MPTEATPTTEAAPAGASSTPTTDYTADAFAALDEALSGGGGRSSAPPPESLPNPASASTPAAEAGEAPPPRRSLLDIARGLKASRGAEQPRTEPEVKAEPAAKESREEAVIRAMQRERELEEITGLAKNDPLAFLERAGVDVAAFLGKATDRALETQADRAAKQREDALKAELAEMKKALDEVKGFTETAKQREAREAAQRSHERAVSDFTKASGDTTKFPVFGALAEDQRVFWGEMSAQYLAGMAREAAAEGRRVDVPKTVDELAELLEGMFADLKSGWLKDATASAGSPRRPGTTINGKLASEAAGRPEPQTDRDYSDSALELINSFTA